MNRLRTRTTAIPGAKPLVLWDLYTVWAELGEDGVLKLYTELPDAPRGPNGRDVAALRSERVVRTIYTLIG